jgi:hypothetical protein
VSDAKALAAGVEELALELLRGRVGDSVHKDVNPGILLFQRGKQRYDVLIVGDIALEAAGAGEIVDQVPGLGFHAFVLVADGQSGSGLVKLLGDAPCDGALVGQPEDHGCLACQIDHAALNPPNL